jgi:hypothetical protein
MKDVNFDKDDFFQNIAMKSHLTFGQLMDIVTGNAKEISDDVLEILAESLSLDIDKLKEMNAKEAEEVEAEETSEESEEKVEESEEEEESEEDEETEEESEEVEDSKSQEVVYAKGTFEGDVQAAIQLGLEKGLDADEAVSDAVLEAKEKHGVSVVSADQYATFFGFADRQKHGEDAADAVSLDSSKESDVNFPNPQIDLQKAQLAMSGTAVQLLREIKSELQLLNTKANTQTPEAEGETVEAESSSEESEDKAAKALDQRKKMLEAFNKRLDKLNI